MECGGPPLIMICTFTVYWKLWSFRFLKILTENYIDENEMATKINCPGFKDFKGTKCKGKPNGTTSRNATRQKSVTPLQYPQYFCTIVRNAWSFDFLITKKPVRTTKQMLELARPKFRGKMDAKFLPWLIKSLIWNDEEFERIRISNASIFQTLSQRKNARVVIDEPELLLTHDFKREHPMSRQIQGHLLINDSDNYQPNALDFLGDK